MVTLAASVISRLLLVASLQLVPTTSLVSCHLSTSPDLEMPLVEAHLVLSAALLQQPPPRSHLLMSVAPSRQTQSCLLPLHQLQMYPPRLASTAALLTQAVHHQHFRPAVVRSVHQHRPLAARKLTLRPRLWTSTVTTRLSLLLLPTRAVSRPRLLQAQVPQYQVLSAFLQAPWLRLQIAHTLLACLVPLGHLRRQAVKAQVLHQSRPARVLLLLRLLPARVLAVLRSFLVRTRSHQLSLARALALLRLPLVKVSSRHLSLARVPLLRQSRPLRAWLFPQLCLARVLFPRLAPPVFFRAVLRASHPAVLKASHPA